MLPVLILTAAYGEGHNAAARGLHAGCQSLGIASEIADPFTAMGSIYERSRRDYLWLINSAPEVWAFAFRILDRWPVVEFSLPWLSRVEQCLAQMLAQKKPRAVVSVHPVYSYLIAKLYPQGAPFKLHTVVTDSITINRVWHRAPSDTFLVPNAATAAVMREQGVAAEKIHDIGFPVPPRFATDRPERLDPRKGARVLFMINAARETAPDVVARLMLVPDIRLTVTVGRDEELRRRVEKAAAGRPIEIHGWTPHMPELLMTHHVLIGKAGGAAVQEAIAAQTPMLITQVVPGQEEGNAKLLFDYSCATLCPTPDAIAAQIDRLFADDAREWRKWLHNIRGLSKPDAALRMAEFIAAN